MRRLAIALLLAATVAGCGRMGELKPTKGMAPTPVAEGADRAATPDELIKPSMQSRPQRNVDLIYRSERRQDDKFELPPGPENGRQD
ncbi:MAG: hypothetical protein ABW184_01325 [Sphingobium sp.]